MTPGGRLKLNIMEGGGSAGAATLSPVLAHPEHLQLATEQAHCMYIYIYILQKKILEKVMYKVMWETYNMKYFLENQIFAILRNIKIKMI